mgnify:CR=1 FL=1
MLHRRKALALALIFGLALPITPAIAATPKPTLAQIEAAKKAEAAKKKAAAATQTAETVELFNLAADPGEKNNLAAANPEVVAKLRARLETYTHDAVPPKAEAQVTGFKVPRVWGEAP